MSCHLQLMAASFSHGHNSVQFSSIHFNAIYICVCVPSLARLIGWPKLDISDDKSYLNGFCKKFSNGALAVILTQMMYGSA